MFIISFEEVNKNVSCMSDWQERWREMDTDDWRCESIVGNDRKCSMVLSKFTAGGAVSLDVREVRWDDEPIRIS